MKIIAYAKFLYLILILTTVDIHSEPLTIAYIPSLTVLRVLMISQLFSLGLSTSIRLQSMLLSPDVYKKHLHLSTQHIYTTQELQYNSITKKYQEYIIEFKPHKLIYQDSPIYIYRSFIYQLNINKINLHNNNNHKMYQMGLNQFSDIQPKQFILKFAKLVIPDQLKSYKNVVFNKSINSYKTPLKPVINNNINLPSNSTNRLLQQQKPHQSLLLSSPYYFQFKHPPPYNNYQNSNNNKKTSSQNSHLITSTNINQNINGNTNYFNTNGLENYSNGNYTIPDNVSIDWTCKASIVVNQGACGSCYVIASLQSIFITMKIYNQSTLPLSIQEVLSCGQPTNGVYGCNGGYFASTFDYMKVNGSGWALMYPYSSQALDDGTTNACNHTLVNSESYKRSKVVIRQAVHIPYRDCRTLVNVLKSHVLAVSISTYGFQFYQNGIYNGKQQQFPNHGVTLVGYDPIKGYKIKNSWGLTWGDRGYAYVSQNTGICDYAMYPILINQDNNVINSC